MPLILICTGQSDRRKNKQANRQADRRTDMETNIQTVSEGNIFVMSEHTTDYTLLKKIALL